MSRQRKRDAVLRLLRGIAVSRENFLFLGSDRGGNRAAFIYTIVETAKLNGLNPEAYLTAVLDAWRTVIPTTGSTNSCPGTSKPRWPQPPDCGAYVAAFPNSSLNSRSLSA